MERNRAEGEERELTGVARSQHLLYVLPQDAAAIPQFLDPLLERLDPERSGTQMLVLTGDADMAVAVASASMRASSARPVRALAVTSAGRSAKLLREPAPVIAGTPEELLELLRSSTLKLEDVSTVVVTWADTLLESADEGAIQSLLGELPRAATRVVVTSELTDRVNDFVERHARRARRVGDVGVTELPPLDLRYVPVTSEGRARTLRRLLDGINPDRCAIYVRTDDLTEDVTAVIRSLGYQEDGAVTVTRDAPVDGALLVLYQMPPSRDALRKVAAGASEVIAMVQPRQLGALRSLTAGGRLLPVQLTGAGASARRREEQMREELRTLLAQGAPTRELLALEPLLEEFDGIELAAAALALLERERTAIQGAAAVRQPADVPEASGTVRVFISAGARDNIAARDLVGAIAGEAGIPGSRIGKIEIRDTHSLVELPADAAEEASRRLTGTVLRGRRLQARVDAARPSRPRDRADGGAGGFRGERDRGEGRSRPGGERRGRPEGGPPRGDSRDRREGGSRPSRPSRPQRD